MLPGDRATRPGPALLPPASGRVTASTPAGPAAAAGTGGASGLRDWICPVCQRGSRTDRTAAEQGFCEYCQGFTGLCRWGLLMMPDGQDRLQSHCTQPGPMIPWDFTWPPAASQDLAVRSALRVLSMPGRPGPLLTGEQDLGRLLVAQDLAARFTAGAVPESLAGRDLRRLDVVGYGAAGQDARDLLRAAVAEISRSGGALIPFLDLRTVARAGADRGPGGAWALLQPMLARGEAVLTASLQDSTARLRGSRLVRRHFQALHYSRAGLCAGHDSLASAQAAQSPMPPVVGSRVQHPPPGRRRDGQPGGSR
jgi:hypothetical protein